MRPSAILAVPLVVVLVVGCRVSPPPLELECQADDDCAFTTRATTGDETCCARCEGTAGKKGWVDGVESFCKDHPHSGKCPALTCAYASWIAKCESHKCALRKGAPIDMEGPAPLDFACKKDDDCGLVPMGANCCSICSGRPGTTTSIDAFHKYCSAHPGKDCPSLDCPKESAHAACVNGGCVVKYTE